MKSLIHRVHSDLLTDVTSRKAIRNIAGWFLSWVIIWVWWCEVIRSNGGLFGCLRCFMGARSLDMLRVRIRVLLGCRVAACFVVMLD